jgi:dienelactone hydrolase
MAEVLFFHHALGLTPWCLSFANELRGAGHVVHAPDLFEGRTFGEIDEGVRHAQEIGFGTIMDRGRAAAEGLPTEIVYAGMSLGVVPAQMLTQTRPGARGAVLISSCVPPSEFGAWPDSVPVQFHMKEKDEIVVTEGDLDAARQLADSFEAVELFLYPGDGHYFVDSSRPEYDQGAATLLKERVLSFLDARTIR